MSTPMMKCGHAANAKFADGKPVCVICIGIVAGADEVDESPPDLTNREAECVYCGKRKPSSSGLAFFEGFPDRDRDQYYCGCKGWD